MDQAINLFDYIPVVEPETELADFPWFLADLNRLDDGYFGGHIEDTEGTLDPHDIDASPAFYYVPADTSSSTSVSSTTTEAMPPQAVVAFANHRDASHEGRNSEIKSETSYASSAVPDTEAISSSSSFPSTGTKPPQAVSPSADNTGAGQEKDDQMTQSMSTLPTSIHHSGTKRRLSDVANHFDAKRARQLDENMQPDGHARQTISGPHFVGASASNTFHLSNISPPSNPFATLRDLGLGLSAPASQPHVNQYPYGPPTSMGHFDYPSHRMLQVPSHNDADLAPSPVAQRTQEDKPEQQGVATPRAGGTQLTAPVVLHFEESDDPARQKTIAAHRANEARTNNTHSIICLWTSTGATEPCHESCKDTKALLEHCVAIHHISGAKGEKEITNCAWADCNKDRISQGGLKRHLKEVHGRQGRVRRTKMQGGSAVA